MQQRPPLILFSGLAADARVFEPQITAFPELVVPEWPTPQPGDTLDSYCDRLADTLRPYGDSILGGASFGGIIALHVAQRLNPRAVILLGSVRSPRELSRLIRSCRLLKSLVPLLPLRFMQACCAPAASGLVARIFPKTAWLARQFRASDPVLFRWSLARILDWVTPPDVSCPVFHIHGDRDRILPVRYTNPDSVIVGGGHVITLTHPSKVNAYIQTAIDQTTKRITNRARTGVKNDEPERRV